ncbi:MAG: UDP-glucose dehydrogenase family protein [Actinomycetota bacterium]
MRIGVVGTGHVGLVTCASLASLGHDVVGADSDITKIDLLNRGEVPFFEPGLPELIAEATASGRLRFTHEIATAVAGAEVVFISVGTPQRATGEANLVAVEAAGRAVARHCTGRCLVVEKSTVPTGTARRLARVLRMERPDLNGQLEVASNPEFLREGSAVDDALHPDRILVGANSSQAHETMRSVYRGLTDDGCEYVETDIATSELAKHASNAFLALRISFINALARICERAGADVVSVASVLGKDPRIGHHFLDAGLGYGGSCFPKDLQALSRISSQLGYEFPLLDEIARINDEAIDAAIDKIREGVWNLEGKRIALLGLAFKPGTDDIRFAPALALARRLLAEGSSVVGYDPVALDNALAEVGGIEPAEDAYEAVRGADCAVLCTEWPEILELDYERLRKLMAYPQFVDGRNRLDAERMRAAGFSYYAMGRPAFGLDFSLEAVAEPAS